MARPFLLPAPHAPTRHRPERPGLAPWKGWGGGPPRWAPGAPRTRPPHFAARPRRPTPAPPREDRPVAGERLERGDITLLHVRRLGHATAAASRSQSYPFSSSSSASSFPPDLTIRPFERTWTTSGWMCVRIR